jgi:hypothetical protein
MERHAAEVASETRELAGQLPVSDAAILLGVSKCRITELQVPRPRTTHEDSGDTRGAVTARASAAERRAQESG